MTSLNITFIDVIGALYHVALNKNEKKDHKQCL